MINYVVTLNNSLGLMFKAEFEANSPEEAMKLAEDEYGFAGYVATGCEICNDRHELTTIQKEEAMKYVREKLSEIFSDPFDLEAVLETIEDDLLSDIRQTSDWCSCEMGEDEWCPTDVEMSLARILKERLGID